jgi:protein-S-isoprenylcysteine O-methyltransferase Ste14
MATATLTESAAVRAAERAHARAWLYLCALLAAHCVEEAVNGFLDVWNPFLATVRARAGLPLPHFTFDGWLTALVIGIVVLTAMAPLVARGVRGFRVASYVFAGLMIANGVNHLASRLYLGQFLPGQFTSPLLMLASIWLILAARRVSDPTTPAGPILGSFLFFLAAPGTVAGWIPHAITGWRTESALGSLAPIRTIGATLIVVAGAALVECFARFAIVGRGVPAPVAPTTTLVVSGLYRHCRNPMYVAVVTAILGQAMVFGSASLLLYAAIVWLAFHLFVLAYEEPTLARQFTNYGEYRQHVPRWLPRLRPWKGQQG